MYYTNNNANLTAREFEILKLLCEGKNNAQISEELNISVHTVKVHLANMYARYDVHNRVQLLVLLLKSNRLGIEDL